MASPPSPPVQPPLLAHQDFTIRVTKSMLSPQYILNLPAKVPHGLGIEGIHTVLWLWVAVTRGHGYLLEFGRQTHPRGGWHSTNKATWSALLRNHDIKLGDEMRFTQIGGVREQRYQLRTARLDIHNVVVADDPRKISEPPPKSYRKYSGEVGFLGSGYSEGCVLKKRKIGSFNNLGSSGSFAGGHVGGQSSASASKDVVPQKVIDLSGETSSSDSSDSSSSSSYDDGPS